MEFTTPLNKLLFNFEVEYIWTFLEIRDTVIASKTNSVLRKSVLDEGLWESLVKRDFFGDKRAKVDLPAEYMTWREYCSKSYWKLKIINVTFYSENIHTEYYHLAHDCFQLTFLRGNKVEFFFESFEVDYGGSDEWTRWNIVYDYEFLDKSYKLKESEKYVELPKKRRRKPQIEKVGYYQNKSFLKPVGKIRFKNPGDIKKRSMCGGDGPKNFENVTWVLDVINHKELRTRCYGKEHTTFRKDHLLFHPKKEWRKIEDLKIKEKKRKK